MKKETDIQFDRSRFDLVIDWIRTHQKDFQTVIPAAQSGRPFVVFDFSVGGKDTMVTGSQRNVDQESQRLFSRLKSENADFGIGLYNEPRECYLGNQFSGNDPSQIRDIHIGVDLFDQAGTIVNAPISGYVHSVNNNDLAFDYGPTVILQHECVSIGQKFWTLYGHLSLETLSHLSPGQEVDSGTTIGWLGAPEVNGGWVAHLHFQIILDLLDYGDSGDFPGVASRYDRDRWLAICPNPNLILGLQEELDYVKRQH